MLISILVAIPTQKLGMLYPPPTSKLASSRQTICHNEESPIDKIPCRGCSYKPKNSMLEGEIA